MVRHEIIPGHDGVIVRIFDAPADGWRTLFVEKDGIVVRYENDSANRIISSMAPSP